MKWKKRRNFECERTSIFFFSSLSSFYWDNGIQMEKSQQKSTNIYIIRRRTSFNTNTQIIIPFSHTRNFTSGFLRVSSRLLGLSSIDCVYM